jgi:hypothetical protein
MPRAARQSQSNRLLKAFSEALKPRPWSKGQREELMARSPMAAAARGPARNATTGPAWCGEGSKGRVHLEGGEEERELETRDLRAQKPDGVWNRVEQLKPAG